MMRTPGSYLKWASLQSARLAHAHAPPRWTEPAGMPRPEYDGPHVSKARARGEVRRPSGCDVRLTGACAMWGRRRLPRRQPSLPRLDCGGLQELLHGRPGQHPSHRRLERCCMLHETAPQDALGWRGRQSGGQDIGKGTPSPGRRCELGPAVVSGCVKPWARWTAALVPAFTSRFQNRPQRPQVRRPRTRLLPGTGRMASSTPSTNRQWQQHCARTTGQRPVPMGCTTCSQPGAP